MRPAYNFPYAKGRQFGDFKSNCFVFFWYPLVSERAPSLHHGNLEVHENAPLAISDASRGFRRPVDALLL